MGEDPGQEQRAFWAILLAMGVLLAWSLLFPVAPPAPGPGEGPGGGRPGEMSALRGAGADSAALGAPGGGGVPPGEVRASAGSQVGVTDAGGSLLRRAGEEPALPDTVVVAGRDLELVIDGRGARVVAATLPGFVEGDGSPVQLLPRRGAGALVSVLQMGGREIPLDGFVFRRVEDATTAEGRRIVWELPLEGLTLRKTYIVPPEGNLFRVEHEIAGGTAELRGWGLSWAGGMRRTEEQRGRGRGSYFAGSVLAEGKVQRRGPNDLRGGPADFPGHAYFVAVQNKYFLGAIVPRGDEQGPARLWAVPAGEAGEPSVAGQILAERVAGLGPRRVTYDVYAGPLDYARLRSLGLGIEGTVDLGWSWVRPLSRTILALLIGLHSVLPNYGIVIILFSLGVNLVFFPLTYKSTKSMRDMAALKPRLDALKEKYKDDPQKLNEATMRLYKEAGVNPLGGCLPLLLQMPVFFALYAVLFHTIELRQAPFVLWIRDLSQPDVIFDLPFALPLIGTGVCLLPIIMGVTSYFQSRATMVDPNQKAMTVLMPIMMTFIFFTMPSGLVLYWLVSNVFTIVQKSFLKPSAAAQATAGG